MVDKGSSQSSFIINSWKNLLVVLCLFVGLLSCNEQTNKPEEALTSGNWVGRFLLDDGSYIPFNFSVSDSTIEISNSTERISTIMKPENDSVVCRFPVFGTKLKFVAYGKDSLSGLWYKDNNQHVLFVAKPTLNANIRFGHSLNSATSNVQGRWKVRFSQNKNPYDAVGVFEQFENEVTGTFLTETGDYRFLQGNVIADSLFLSCFDGAHAFLFKAQKREDTLSGVFYSGNSYIDSSWSATKSDSFELADPYKITRLNNDSALFSFAFPSVSKKGDTIRFPSDRFNNKVVIVQILGSWCPNCRDESVFLSKLYDEYHPKGLEIIGVGFEKQNSLEERIARLRSYSSNLSINYPIGVGGGASKKEASESFNQLNNISSFPTCLFIDKVGRVRKIHTGFYGPSTGLYYHEYTVGVKTFIEELLNE